MGGASDETNVSVGGAAPKVNVKKRKTMLGLDVRKVRKRPGLEWIISSSLRNDNGHPHVSIIRPVWMPVKETSRNSRKAEESFVSFLSIG